jgi:hypothetical protein
MTYREASSVLIVYDMTVPKIMRVHSLDETAYVLKLEVKPKSISSLHSSIRGKASSCIVNPSGIHFAPTNRVLPYCGEGNSNEDSKRNDFGELCKYDRMPKLPSSQNRENQYSLGESVIQNQSMFAIDEDEFPQEWKLNEVKSTTRSQENAAISEHF